MAIRPRNAYIERIVSRESHAMPLPLAICAMFVGNALFALTGQRQRSLPLKV